MILGIKENAMEFHKRGFNCAQSVLCACGKYTGMDEKAALSVSAGFGGGMRCGEMCGAVSGAIMALGCAFPVDEENVQTNGTKIASLAREVSSDFMKNYGCLRCVDLKKARHSCDELIMHGAELAEKIIEENK